MAPTAKIEIDGKEYTLMLDLNALIAFEEATGKSAEFLDAKKISLKDMRALYWAALVGSHPEITQEDVGRLIHLGNMEDFTNAFKPLYEAYLADKIANE
jgi:hypothetical protein